MEARLAKALKRRGSASDELPCVDHAVAVRQLRADLAAQAKEPGDLRVLREHGFKTHELSRARAVRAAVPRLPLKEVTSAVTALAAADAARTAPSKESSAHASLARDMPEPASVAEAKAVSAESASVQNALTLTKARAPAPAPQQPRPTQHVCPVCSRSFKALTHLRVHARSHRQRDEDAALEGGGDGVEAAGGSSGGGPAGERLQAARRDVVQAARAVLGRREMNFERDLAEAREATCEEGGSVRERGGGKSGTVSRTGRRARRRGGCGGTERKHSEQGVQGDATTQQLSGVMSEPDAIEQLRHRLSAQRQQHLRAKMAMRPRPQAAAAALAAADADASLVAGAARPVQRDNFGNINTDSSEAGMLMAAAEGQHEALKVLMDVHEGMTKTSGAGATGMREYAEGNDGDAALGGAAAGALAAASPLEQSLAFRIRGVTTVSSSRRDFSQTDAFSWEADFPPPCEQKAGPEETAATATAAVGTAGQAGAVQAGTPGCFGSRGLLLLADGHGPCGGGCADFVVHELPHQLLQTWLLAERELGAARAELLALGAAAQAEQQVGQGPALNGLELFERERDKQLSAALKGAYRQTDMALAAAPSLDHRQSGACCTAVVLTTHEAPEKPYFVAPGQLARGHPAKLLVACAGSVRAVLGKVRPDKAVFASAVTRDHKVTIEAEKKRVLAQGALVCPACAEDGVPFGPPLLWASAGAGQQGLATTRSIGDWAARSVGVTPDPDVYAVPLDSESAFLLVASDGLWDVVGMDEAVAIVSVSLRHGQGAEKACQKLLKKATKQWSLGHVVREDVTISLIWFADDLID